MSDQSVPFILKTNFMASENKKEWEHDYPLIPASEITEEARELAVRWVEGYEPVGKINLQQKHELASDIMNYARRKGANWVTEKPVITQDCILIAATKIREYWDYTLFEIEYCNEAGYFMILDDGDEWGDIGDLKADKYLVLQPLK